MTEPLDVTETAVAQMRAWRALRTARDAYETAAAADLHSRETCNKLRHLRAAEQAFKEADKAAKAAQDEAAADLVPAPPADQADLFGGQP